MRSLRDLVSYDKYNLTCSCIIEFINYISQFFAGTGDAGKSTFLKQMKLVDLSQDYQLRMHCKSKCKFTLKGVAAKLFNLRPIFLQ